MILEWQHEGNTFRARGDYHAYEIDFDAVGKACLIQSSNEPRVSPGMRITSGFVAATRMMGQAQAWESEVVPPGSTRRHFGRHEASRDDEHGREAAREEMGDAEAQQSVSARTESPAIPGPSKRRESKRWTERIFGWGPFGSSESAPAELTPNRSPAKHW